MKKRSLSWSRRLIAGVVFGLFFLAFALPIMPASHIARWQIGPALLGGGFVFLGAAALATLCLGRVYCAAFCPLGITQDLLGRVFGKKRRRPLPNHLWARVAVLGVFAIALAGGFLFIYGLLDPYSAFGRICAAIFAPITQWLNNLLAAGAEAAGSSAFARQEIHFAGWPALLAGLATLVALAFLVWKLGRVWCNYCPVGTALGLLGSRALFRIQLDPEKCVGCRRCERVCKTGCIDIGNGSLDSSRCVACQNCAEICPTEALAYGKTFMKPNPENRNVSSRRAFLAALAPALLALRPGSAKAAANQEINRPDVMPQRRETTSRAIPITPPGSLGVGHFAGHCIGCQLCVAACPSNTLSTSLSGAGILQPALSYEFGYCRPNCVKCGEVCPAGAIAPLTPGQKARIRFGLASVDFQRCIVNVDQVACTACQRICPNGAISLVEVADSAQGLKRPVVDSAKCTGCGACEYICAARPLAAITVSGLEAHEQI
ncbi:MAG: 4Fe-4S dicluster domain-containing protein [Desulfovibrio sp.]|nr:4Fe-4S dicluster domain-containing protein [Desulfovibrio sp.]